MDKRGIISYNVLIKILDLVFLVVVVFTLMFMVNSLYVASIDTSQTEADLFISRVLYSADSISYKDPLTLRTYPGIVDISRFRGDVLSNSVKFDKNFIYARLTLTDRSGAIMPASQAIYFDKKGFDVYYPIAQMKVIGAASAMIIESDRYVLIRNPASGALAPAILKFEVVMPS